MNRNFFKDFKKVYKFNLEFQNEFVEQEWQENYNLKNSKRLNSYIAVAMNSICCNYFQFENQDTFVRDFFFYFQISILLLCPLLIKLFTNFRNLIASIMFSMWLFFLAFPYWYFR